MLIHLCLVKHMSGSGGLVKWGKSKGMRGGERILRMKLGEGFEVEVEVDLWICRLVRLRPAVVMAMGTALYVSAVERPVTFETLGFRLV